MSRAIRRGIERWLVSPAAPANPAAPTRAEITASTVITESIAAVNGFALTNSPVTTPDMGSRFDKTVAGIDSAGDSSLNMWDEILQGAATGDPARDVLAKDSELTIYRMPYGDVPGKRMEVWQVTSTGVNDQIDLSAAGQYQVGFSIREVPEQNAVVPAAAATV
ncbi:phage tail tube protein [Geodermatophilus chilensis]|uniref:phage tail tube protein n=1 Tax=Geodermatophilus chilensis TaxID=2035835 RepID=UPI0012FFFA8A|nr:hypothetical protein [Geodermatophilus chilensis]